MIQNITKVFLVFYLYIIIIYDWITIIRYSKHKISTNKHIVLPRKKFSCITPPPTTTSPQWPLSSFPKVAVVESFHGDCIILITSQVYVLQKRY